MEDDIKTCTDSLFARSQASFFQFSDVPQENLDLFADEAFVLEDEFEGFCLEFMDVALDAYAELGYDLVNTLSADTLSRLYEGAKARFEAKRLRERSGSSGGFRRRGSL